MAKVARSIADLAPTGGALDRDDRHEKFDAVGDDGIDVDDDAVVHELQVTAGGRGTEPVTQGVKVEAGGVSGSSMRRPRLVS